MTHRFLGAVALAAGLAIGCGSPTTPTSATPLAGTWASTTTNPAQDTCTNFRWTVASTGDVGTGVFTATCNGTLAITGTATATRNGSTFAWTATASGTLAGGFVCDVALTGTITIDSHGRLSLPFTGSTCAGSVAGTEILGQ